MGFTYTPGNPNYNASANPAQTLTIGLDFYTLTTSVNILNVPVSNVFTDVENISAVAPSVADFTNIANAANVTSFVAGTIPNDFSQDALDKLVEIVAQRGQPIIMGTPTFAAGVYTMKFAVEHLSVWGVVATSTPQPVPALVSAIQAAGIDFGFNVDASLAATVANSF